MTLVRQVRRDGQVREADVSLQPRRGTTSYVHARVAPLTSRLILVLADDRTREHRVESIRRDFVANVSHELKTPVGALNLLAEAVGEAKDDPEAVVRFSSRMHLESERLTRLVQQIIDLSRLQNDILSDDADHDQDRRARLRGDRALRDRRRAQEHRDRHHGRARPATSTATAPSCTPRSATWSRTP